MRGATDFGPRGGQATAQRLLADVDTTRPRAECDTNHVRCRGAKSFVDDLGLSRGVVLSRAVHFCDLLRLSPLTRRFVRFRRTRLHFQAFFAVPLTVGCWTLPFFPSFFADPLTVGCWT